MHHELVCHPDTPCPAVQSLSAEVERVGPDRLSLHYSLLGDLAGLAIPAPVACARVDGLWAHTCFEAFADVGGDSYLEFNFSPSGQWAAYGFDGYRLGMAPLEGLPPPELETVATATSLNVRVILTVPLKAPIRLGLTAVVETIGGGMSYWALGHPPGRPDFHNAHGRLLTL